MRNNMLFAPAVFTFLFIVTTAGVIIPPLTAMADEQVSVTVTGKAPIKDGNVSTARKIAIMDAQRRAVEQGAGLKMKLLNAEDLRQVNLSTHGKVINYTILNESSAQNIYQVTIKAQVLFTGEAEPKRKYAVSHSSSDGDFDPYVVEDERGLIDWKEGFIIARGRAKPGTEAKSKLMAERAALADAHAVALELLEGVAVNESRKVKHLKTDPVVFSKIDATIRNAEVKDTYPSPDGKWILVEIKVPLYGVTGVTKVIRQKLYPAKKLPKDKTSKTSDSQAQGYTGLVVRADSTNAKPALFPTLESAQGAVVYSPDSVDSAKAEQEGMASYVTPQSGTDDESNPQGMRYWLHNSASPLFASTRPVLLLPGVRTFSLFFTLLQNATSDSPPKKTRYPRRAGRKPLVVKAINSRGAEKTTVIISKEDAEKIKSSAELQKSLKDCRVVVVLRSEAGGTEGRLLPKFNGKLASVHYPSN